MLCGRKVAPEPFALKTNAIKGLWCLLLLSLYVVLPPDFLKLSRKRKDDILRGWVGVMLSEHILWSK